MGLGAIAIGVGAATAIGGTVVGAISSSKAAHAQTDAANTASQTQLNMYNQTRSDLMPYNRLGSNAFSQLAGYFGFGGSGAGSGTNMTVGAPGTTGPYATPATMRYTPEQQAYFEQNPDIAQAYGIDTSQFGQPAPSAQPSGSGSAGGPDFSLLTSQLENTPGYQFTLGQGTQALDRSAASRGLTLSGAQLKDSQAYGQGLAMSNAYQPYIDNLKWAAGLGESAASQTGNIGASAASGIASSQLAAGQSQAAGYVSQGNIIGSGLSQLGQIAQNYGSSYGRNSNVLGDFSV